MSFQSFAIEQDSPPPSIAMAGMRSDAAFDVTPSSLSLLSDGEAFLSQIHVPKEARLSFEVQGIPFQASLGTKENEKNQCVLWAELGYLPYSVTDALNRMHIITILESAQNLPHVNFGVNRHMKILVKGVYTVEPPLLPVSLFVPLTQFLQESLPMIRLIGQYL